MTYPKKVQIELTNHCNLKCRGCMRENMKREKGYISINTFFNSLNFCSYFGIEEIHLHHWGEPLLHPYIINYTEIAHLLDFKVGFTTNGKLLTHDKLIKLKEAGLDKLDISYNKNTKSRTLINLYHISNDLGIDTWFRTVIFSKTDYDELKEELKGFKVRFQRGMYFDFNKKRIKPCKAIEMLFIINWNGVITPCCPIYDNQYTYGKVGEITVEELKFEIDKLRVLINSKSEILNTCCNYCHEIDDVLPLNFKL